MVKNEQGQVALVYYQPTPRVVTIAAKPKPKNFAFVVQHAVSLCWVDAEYVDRVMATMVYCCGNSAKPAFHYASEAAIKVWDLGHY